MSHFDLFTWSRFTLGFNSISQKEKCNPETLNVSLMNPNHASKPPSRNMLPFVVGNVEKKKLKRQMEWRNKKPL